MRGTVKHVRKRLSIRRFLFWLDSALPIVSPNSRNKLIWDSFVLVLVVYNALAVPYDFAFGLRVGAWLGVLDYCVEGVFAIDVAMSTRMSYIDSTGENSASCNA